VKPRFVFFLGGHDLEMLAIRDLLETNVPFRFHDKGLSWGAKTSDYSEEIGACLSNGDIPVLIELQDDVGLDLERVVIIDHHGERAGVYQPTSLHQVFDLLQLPREAWSRWFELVAANDRGYIPAVREAGATQEEIVKVRAADRAAQGITVEEEVQGAKAVAQAEVRANGRLTLVRLPHSRTAAVTDRLEPALGGPGYQNLLVISPRQLNFFGEGRVIFALNWSFPEGWYGGAPPERGFWGHSEPPPTAAEVIKIIEDQF
jgi:hypothetical protein